MSLGRQQIRRTAWIRLDFDVQRGHQTRRMGLGHGDLFLGGRVHGD